MEQRQNVDFGYFDLTHEGHCHAFLTHAADNDQGQDTLRRIPQAVRALMDAAMDQAGTPHS